MSRPERLLWDAQGHARALAQTELGAASRAGGSSVFLCTRHPAWQEALGKTLMCFPASLKGNSQR